MTEQEIFAAKAKDGTGLQPRTQATQYLQKQDYTRGSQAKT